MVAKHSKGGRVVPRGWSAMSERRVLVDNSRALARIVDGLHDVVDALDGRPFAIVGGIAVLAHVQGHRVTQDIDSAARGRGREIRDALLLVGVPDRDGGSDIVLPNGVPVDLLIAGDDLPGAARGRGRQAKLREATGHAIRWAIETARLTQLVCEPENSRGPVVVPVASISALLAMKTISMKDPSRGDKVATDRLDLWLLLTRDVDRAADALRRLCDAPAPARRWAAEVLAELLRDAPDRLLTGVASGLGAPRTVADVGDVWEAVVEPHMDRLRR